MSDTTARTVRMEVVVPHLQGDGGPFIVTFGNVASARVTVVVRPPGEPDLRPGTSWDEQQHALEGYWKTWRELSLGWEEFQQSLATDPLMISESQLLLGEGHAAFRAGGFLDGDRFDDQYATITIRCESITFSRATGEELSLEQLLDIGDTYWDRIAVR